MDALGKRNDSYSIDERGNFFIIITSFRFPLK